MLLAYQEIIIHTSAQNQVLLHLEEYKAGSRSTFVSGVVFYDYETQEMGPVPDLTFHMTTAKAVFEKVLSTTADWLANRKETVISISNTCNTEFVGVAEQKEALDKIGATHAMIKVNGAIVA